MFITGFAQQELFVGAELLGGTLTGSKVQSDLLRQRNYSPTLGAQLSLGIRFFNRFTIEGGIGQHWSRARLIDEDFKDFADDFSVKIRNNYSHWNYYTAFSSYFRIKKTDTYAYAKFALSLNNYKAETVSANSSFAISNLNIDRDLNYSTSYEESNLSFIPELGVQHQFYKGNLLSLGLRYNLGQSLVYKSTYTVSDNSTQISKTDALESMGDNITLSVKYDFRLYHFEKKEKAKKIDIDQIALDVSTNKPIDTLDKEPTDEPDPSYDPPGRKQVISERIKVNSKKVTVSIWDHQSVDGDRVSLNFNNRWILENYTLKKEKYIIELDLVEGVNTFVLHALNLGKIRPNTAALIVDDGEKQHRIILQSTLKKSGTLQIKYKKNAGE